MSSTTAENEVPPGAVADEDATTSITATGIIPIVLKAGFNCIVRGNTNTWEYSKVPIELKRGNNETISKVTFVGDPGPTRPMKVQSSGAYEWTIKAAPTERSLHLKVLHSKKEQGLYVSSKVGKPIEIKKRPEDGKIYQEFSFTVVLSEDWTNNTWDDAVITVVQWK